MDEGGRPSIVEVLGVVEGIVPEGLRESDIVGADKLAAELGGDLVKEVAPAALVVAAEGGIFFFIHFEIRGESGFSGEDPAPSPVPPLPDGTAGGGDRFGTTEGPCGGWRSGNGGGLDLEVEGERGKPPADSRTPLPLLGLGL